MDYEVVLEKIRLGIKNLRIEKGMSQEDVSGIDMGVRNYQKLESGASYPSLRSLLIIANSLGVHPKELLSVEIESETPKRKKQRPRKKSSKH